MAALASFPSGSTTQSTREGKYEIRRVAVLGAGTMGARIAAHVANAGLPVLLLDIAPKEGDHNAIVNAAFEVLKKAKPAAFADKSYASRVTVGNFDDDLAKLKDCDWIIEAVAENMDIKRGLLDKVLPNLRPTAILTTNTSGLPIGKIAENLPADVRKRWFGTHFFNPPRYMKLLEIIPTAESDPKAVEAVSEFGEQILGKTIVLANDVPNFIANRIGTFGMLNTFDVMGKQGLAIEEIDTLTGSVLGWPKTGTFRLTDMVGIDVLWSVARNFATNASDERSDLKLPEAVNELVQRKWLGDKTKQGFYKKERGADGKENRMVLDLNTFEYKPSVRPNFPELDMLKSNESLAARLKALFSADPKASKAAAFYWKALPDTWSYAANRIGEVGKSIVEIDAAMRTGFNWEMGPFQMWDAAGVTNTIAKMKELGAPIPAAVEKLLASGGTSWYRNDGEEYFDPASGKYFPVNNPVSSWKVADYKKANGIFKGNSAISLVDLGDGIGCFEFHSKMNSLGEDTIRFMHAALQPDSDAMRNFDAFIIANDAANFSVGANLMQLLMNVQDEEWDDIQFGIRAFQTTTKMIKFSPRPVVTAAAGMCLGGGAEMALHSALRQPHLELYTGLVEAGVGLLPGGGGTKEMVLRALASADSVKHDPRGESVEVHEAIRAVFENIAMAKVSTSAIEARALRLVEPTDAITMHRDRLIGDAKAQALRLVRSGYTAPTPRMDVPAPGNTVLASLKVGIYMMREAEFISDHDMVVGKHIANVLCGGDVTPGTLMSEDRLLELEGEAFLSLCGEKKTQERIGFTLKTGKPLRN